jgi:hypothetical protein
MDVIYERLLKGILGIKSKKGVIWQLRHALMRKGSQINIRKLQGATRKLQGG